MYLSFPVPDPFNGQEFIDQMTARGLTITTDDFIIDGGGSLRVTVEDPAWNAEIEEALTEHVGGPNQEFAVEQKVNKKLADALADLQVILDTPNSAIDTTAMLARQVKDLARIQRLIIRKLTRALDTDS